MMTLLRSPRRRLLAAVLLSAAMTGFPWAAAEAGTENLVVVELFTSQGCNSCPPADAYLGELAAREDVLPLSFHVNYWDYLGWRDTLATEDGTLRQRRYREYLGSRYVYTPQMVIGGRFDAVGSHRDEVEAAIERQRRDTGAAVKVELIVDDQERVSARLSKAAISGEASLWLVRYNVSEVVEIRRNEHAGKTIVYSNVVRDITHVGDWDGSATDVPLAQLPVLRMGGRDACALLVQDKETGAILGAAKVALGQPN